MIGQKINVADEVVRAIRTAQVYLQRANLDPTGIRIELPIDQWTSFLCALPTNYPGVLHTIRNEAVEINGAIVALKKKE